MQSGVNVIEWMMYFALSLSVNELFYEPCSNGHFIVPDCKTTHWFIVLIEFETNAFLEFYCDHCIVILNQSLRLQFLYLFGVHVNGVIQVRYFTWNLQRKCMYNYFLPKCHWVLYLKYIYLGLEFLNWIHRELWITEQWGIVEEWPVKIEGKFNCNFSNLATVYVIFWFLLMLDGLDLAFNIVRHNQQFVLLF